MQDYDHDLISEERQERYNRKLQRRLATCGDRLYPATWHLQDIIAAELERNRLLGIVDISEVEK